MFIYYKEGKSEEYEKLKREFEEELKRQAINYKDKIVKEVKEGKRNSAYKTLRKLGDGPDEKKRKPLTIASFQDKNFSDKESADALAAHFSAISQSFPPLNVDNLSPVLAKTIKDSIKNTVCVNINSYHTLACLCV